MEIKNFSFSPSQLGISQTSSWNPDPSHSLSPITSPYDERHFRYLTRRPTPQVTEQAEKSTKNRFIVNY